MFVRNIQAAAFLCLATFAADRAAAQAVPADVTFTVPVNLTRLPDEITRIKVICQVDSPAILAAQGKPVRLRQGESELVVSQSEVVTTAQVVVPVSASELNNPSGVRATYECRLSGFHQSAQQSIHTSWHDLHHTSISDSACQLTPRPMPIIGNFNW